VDAELLYATLLKWLDQRAPAASAAAAGAAPGRAHADAPGGGSGSPGLAAVDDGSVADLDGIPGLTMSRALVYLPGRPAVFARVLGRFVDNYANGMPPLDAAVQARRWTEARRFLHALRGACGAIGALALLDQAQAAERLLSGLDDGAPPPTGLAVCLAQLAGTLQDMVDAVASRLSAAAGAAQ
jgi:two-component system sensor histidine kinase/response regulator